MEEKYYSHLPGCARLAMPRKRIGEPEEKKNTQTAATRVKDSDQRMLSE